jgi:hypothetical protein
MIWSDNVKNPPNLNVPDEFDPSKRAYPFISNVPDNVIHVTDKAVTFKGQRGPIKEHGINGCQIDDMITFALGTIQTFNKKFPCRENSLAITKLEEALHWLNARKRDRKKRQVEGFNKE